MRSIGNITTLSKNEYKNNNYNQNKNIIETNLKMYQGYFSNT